MVDALSQIVVSLFDLPSDASRQFIQSVFLYLKLRVDIADSPFQVVDFIVE